MRPDVLSGTVRADLLDGLVLLAAVVWLWAGVAKLRWGLAPADIDALVPGWGRFQPLLRWAVPAAEIAVGLALLTGIGAGAAGLTGALLAATFALLHLTALVRAALADAPLGAGCGCFGRSRLAVAPVGTSTTLDATVITSRSWSVGQATVLAMLTWLATLPCMVCG